MVYSPWRSKEDQHRLIRIENLRLEVLVRHHWRTTPSIHPQGRRWVPWCQPLPSRWKNRAQESCESEPSDVSDVRKYTKCFTSGANVVSQVEIDRQIRWRLTSDTVQAKEVTLPSTIRLAMS